MRNFFRLCSISLLSVLFVLNLEAQTEAPNLEIGKIIEKEISGGQSHSFQMRLKPNQFVHAVIMQKGIDVVVRFYEPNGAKMAEFDNPCGLNGADILHLLTQAEGNYRLEIITPGNNKLNANLFLQ